MSNYSIGGNYDLVKEKNEIVKILEATEDIKDLPKGFDNRCHQLFNYVIFSMLLPHSSAYENRNFSKDDKFLSYMIIKIKRKVNYVCPTAYVSFHNNEFLMGFNPYYLFKLSLFEMIQVIKHELYHLVFNHLLRYLPSQNRVFSQFELNMATDMTVNGFIPHINGIVDEKMFKDIFEETADGRPRTQTYITTGKEVEFYLEYIKESKFHHNLQKQNQCIKELAETLINSADKINKNGEDFDWKDVLTPEEYEKFKDLIEKTLTKSSPELYDDEKITKVPVQINSYRDKNEDMQDEASSKIATEQLRALMNEANSKCKGDVSSAIRKAIQAINTKPQLKWQDYFKRYIGSVPVPYKKSILRNDRRQPNRLELKGRLSDYEVNVIVAVDVSGSVSDEEFRDFINEIFFITKAIKKKRIFLIQCDCEITSARTITKPNDVLKLDRTGQGGTEFSPVFEYIKDHGMRNDVLIYFTDGCGERELSVKPRHYKTLWVTNSLDHNGNPNMSLEEPYGIVKYIEPTDKHH